MSFLPQGYDVPASAGNYMKFEDGQNRFRILSPPIIGWLDWDKANGKKVPLRYRYDQKPEAPKNPAEPVKHFWAMVVYNYGQQSIQILEITQSTIQHAIKAFAEDSDFGDPRGYDIKVTKSGAGLDTSYTIVPLPPKPLAAEVQEMMRGVVIHLEALFESGDPFNWNGPGEPETLGAPVVATNTSATSTASKASDVASDLDSDKFNGQWEK